MNYPTRLIIGMKDAIVAIALGIILILTVLGALVDLGISF